MLDVVIIHPHRVNEDNGLFHGVHDIASHFAGGGGNGGGTASGGRDDTGGRSLGFGVNDDVGNVRDEAVEETLQRIGGPEREVHGAERIANPKDAISL